MEKISVYIFNGQCRAAAYGIGTYIEELKHVCHTAGIKVGIVNLCGRGISVTEVKDQDTRIINIPNVPGNHINGSQYYSRNVAYLLKEFIREDKDTKLIFQLNFMSDPYLVTSLKRLFRKSKVILVAHYTSWSFDLMGDENKFMSILKKTAKSRTVFEKSLVKTFRADVQMIQKVDKFVCVAQHTLNTFVKCGKIDREKSQVINNALTDEYTPVSCEVRLQLRKKYKIGNDEQVILFVGRLDKMKGVEPLIESFKILLKNHPRAHLFFLGEGDFSHWLNCASDDWTRITFTGILKKAQVQDFYRMADVGVVSSLHEEFGLVAIEMMMHRVPIVVGDTGGLAEIVEDNVSGLKAPVVDKDGQRTIAADELAERIGRIIDSHALAALIAENGRKKYLACYESSLFASKMLNLYKTV
jgi:glycosyltransferase